MNVREFALAIERAEIAKTRACIDSARRVRPNVSPALLEIAGGVAGFAGADSPFWEATGMGMDAPVTGADVARVTEFYESRGAVPMVMVNPLADVSLGHALARAGYVPNEYQSALVADLAQVRGKRDPRITVATDAAQFARTSARGFLGREDDAAPPLEWVAIGEIVSSAAGVTPLEGRETDGTVAATGAMDAGGDLAGLFGSSTLPQYRRRGWQTALICDRIARAQAAGARYARAAADAGSASEANFVRCGFRVLYTRVRWDRGK